MQAHEATRRRPAKVWVPIVLVIGILAGLALSMVPIPTTTPSPGRGPGWGFRLETATDVDMILSTVSVALLIALLAVYLRIYGDTKANFALGLVVVLVALLLQSILTSPLVFGVFGVTTDGIGAFLLFADLFKILAFTVFLYLSLE